MHILYCFNCITKRLLIECQLPFVDIILQTCMEMTNPICSDGKFDMFKPSTWDPIEFSNGCQRKFGVRPRMSWAGVQWWAKNLNTVTRLIFRFATQLIAYLYR